MVWWFWNKKPEDVEGLSNQARAFWRKAFRDDPATDDATQQAEEAMAMAEKWHEENLAFDTTARDAIVVLIGAMALLVVSFSRLRRARESLEHRRAEREQGGFVPAERSLVATGLCACADASGLAVVLLLVCEVAAKGVSSVHSELEFPGMQAFFATTWYILFWSCYASFFVALPYAYLYDEAAGWIGRKTIHRLLEAFIVLGLLLTLWLGTALLAHTASGAEVGFWTFHYCAFAASGSVLLLACTPIGFVQIIFATWELRVALYGRSWANERQAVIEMEIIAIKEECYREETRMARQSEAVSNAGRNEGEDKMRHRALLENCLLVANEGDDGVASDNKEGGQGGVSVGRGRGGGRGGGGGESEGNALCEADIERRTKPLIEERRVLTTSNLARGILRNLCFVVVLPLSVLLAALTVVHLTYNQLTALVVLVTPPSLLARIAWLAGAMDFLIEILLDNRKWRLLYENLLLFYFIAATFVGYNHTVRSGVWHTLLPTRMFQTDLLSSTQLVVFRTGGYLLLSSSLPIVVRLLDMEGLVKLAIEPFLSAVMVQNAYVLVLYRSVFLGASVLSLLPTFEGALEWWRAVWARHVKQPA